MTKEHFKFLIKSNLTSIIDALTYFACQDLKNPISILKKNKGSFFLPFSSPCGGSNPTGQK